MRSKIVGLLAFAVLVSGVSIVFAQEPGDDDVRGAFLSSRPKTINANARSRRHKPRSTNSNASATAKNANTGKTSTANANTNSSANRNSSSMSARPQAIGLGYTLLMLDPSGKTVRVEPGREFHEGDRVRISLEPNIDGYLYVFNTTDNGAPVMIYPDARLDAGNNEIEAHVPLEVPSSEETDSGWFKFDKNAGAERLYIVVTREPLGSVPISDDLVILWSAQKRSWQPSAEVWSQIQEATKAEVRTVTSKTFGQAQSETEKNATTRGLGLDQSAPQPSIIRINAVTNTPVLVTVLDLIHK